MPAIDTIACFQTTVNSSLAAGVFATGDSGVVRNFQQPAYAQLLAVMYDDVTSAQPFRIRSPLLHDNVQGLRFYPGENGAPHLLPQYMTQKLQPQDTLTIELSTAASTGKAVAVPLIYYNSLPGATARLHTKGDIMGIIKNIKPLVVTISSGGNTAGIWQDVVITTTEDLLHANTDYAVLGLLSDNTVSCLAIKGIDTGNLRVGAPGITRSEINNDWFVRLSDQTGLPTIPVFNSANKGSTYVSLMSSAATGANTDVTLILAELAQNLAN
jgi:hypothetical protein